MNNLVLKVNDLSVSFNDRSVLNHIHFEVMRGDTIAIVGPNGSGKTTLFRAILGLAPYKGEILVNGEPVAKNLRRIGYVPQRFTFDRTIPMTVHEFLDISFEKVNTIKIEHALQEVDMLRHEHDQIGTLSGGQFRRILIARALMNDPFLLLLDEATTGVDVSGAKNFYEIIAHLNEIHQTTVLFISHEINMVHEFANHVLCLNRDLICFGKSKEAITKEVLEKLYGKEFRFREHTHL